MILKIQSWNIKWIVKVAVNDLETVSLHTWYNIQKGVKMYAPRKALLKFYVSFIFSNAARIQLNTFEFFHPIFLPILRAPFDFTSASFLEWEMGSRKFSFFEAGVRKRGFNLQIKILLMDFSNVQHIYLSLSRDKYVEEVSTF